MVLLWKNREFRKLILLAITFVILFYFADMEIFKRDETDEGDWDNKVAFGNCEFRLEFVSDDASRKAGLSNRDSLCDECGMLFEFPSKGMKTFWMKDMKFDLDIIWIEDQKVIGIEKDIKYDFKGIVSSPDSTDRVLEINARKSDECKIKEGSELKQVRY